MAKPRRVVPGATYLLTRRVYQRTLRLRPHPVTNEIARYCLAWAAARFGILVHAFVVMSSHQHLVVTDPHGRLPDFLRELHRNMAKALNASQGQWENLWSAEHASAVALPTVEDVLAKIGYSAANPVAAALVEEPEQWPGVLLWQPGTAMVVQRPKVYFDPLGDAPETVELRIVRLPGQSDDDSQWASRVRDAVESEVRKARAEVREQGMAFVGAVKTAAKSFLERAKSYELKRRINPILAARDVLVRKACLLTQRAFQRAYRAALTAWKDGDRTVAFPFGTWWMREHHKAEVLSPE
jgi:REP element-mobilizing transposase RayT